ncbi:hypothetical protein BH09BAC4_BH09BAC4_28670 [soil metagenome]
MYQHAKSEEGQFSAEDTSLPKKVSAIDPDDLRRDTHCLFSVDG